MKHLSRSEFRLAFFPISARICCLVTILTVTLAVMLSGIAADALVLLLDNFEDGVGEWRTNDSNVAGSERLATLCSIYPTSNTPPRGGGAQAAMIDFESAEGAWASVSLPVEGRAWADAEAGQLQMWVRGRAGQKRSVDVTLRASVPTGDGRREDRSYVQTVPLEGDEWQRINLRFFGFKTADDQMLTSGIIRHIYLLQFVKSGTWKSVRFDVDDIRVAPSQQEPPDNRPVEQETVIINFERDLGRMLAQIGFNLVGTQPATVSDRTVLTRLSEHTAGLAPCVGRIPITADEAASDALGIINRNVNWLLDMGIRPMISFNARSAGRTASKVPADDLEDFANLVELRRGSQERPYYELCTAPASPDVDGGLVAQRYNDAAAVIGAADDAMRLGGPCFAQPPRGVVEPFVEASKRPYFVSYSSIAQPADPPRPERLMDIARYGTSLQADTYDYQAIRSTLQNAQGRPELYLTDWGLARPEPPVGPDAALVAQAHDAVFLATGALNASRWVDKLIWHRLIDDHSGLLHSDGTPRAPYRAAWLINTYAPRGAGCRAVIPFSTEIFIAAVRTRTAYNVFVINWNAEGGSLPFRAVGITKPTTVRERKLDPYDVDVIQHRNRGATLSQTVRFEGPGISVIQFIGSEDAPD